MHERITHVSCIGQNQGEINLNVSGGEAPYSYLWSNGFKGKDLKGVEEGIYQVLITDASNCTFQGSYMVQASGEIQLGEKIEMPTCNSSENGGIELAISGGRPPYTIRWGDNSVQQTLHNLGEGDYQVKITDALGCSLEKVFALKAQSQLKVSILKVDQVSCFGGMDGAIALGISGAKGKLKIIWEDDAVAGLERRNLKAGIYKVQISDDFDCPISREIELKETEQLMAKIESVVEKNCDSGDLVGRAWVIVTGGKGPYSFHWLDSGLKATEIQFRQSGSLKVKIMDAVGCTAEVQTQVVFPNLDSREEDSLAFEVRKLAINSEPQIRVGDELIFEPQFLTKFISWEWDFGDGQKSSQKSPSYRYGKSGFFEVQLLAKDSYGCTSIQKAQVLVQSNELLLIPNAFSPNGDQLNDFFVPRMSGFKEVKIQIFNIWGELLYTQTHLDGPGWDGTYSGQIAPVGNYIYKLDYINQEGIKKSSTGTIALIR